MVSFCVYERKTLSKVFWTGQLTGGPYVRMPCSSGADPGRGGGGLGVRIPPPFWGTPKHHQKGKNVMRVCV